MVYSDRKPEIRQIGSGELGGGGIRTGKLIKGQQMKSEIVKKMQSKFDDLVQTVPNEGIKFWFARDIQKPLAIPSGRTP